MRERERLRCEGESGYEAASHACSAASACGPAQSHCARGERANLRGSHKAHGPDATCVKDAHESGLECAASRACMMRTHESGLECAASRAYMVSTYESGLERAASRAYMMQDGM